MTQLETREDAVAVIVDRTELLNPNQLRRLASELSDETREAIKDFSVTVDLTPTERDLLLKHNTDIRTELLAYAQVKEDNPNIKVEWPPRNN